jgi:CRISPR-associated endonuclease/helicase Cas3
MPDLKTVQGEPVTDEMLEALAAEAEAGYDPATLQPRKTGRPSLGSGTSPRVQFRVSPSVYQEAQEQAKAEDRTLSELARALLEDYVRSHRATAERRRAENAPARSETRRASRRRRATT